MDENLETPKWLMKLFEGWFDPVPYNSNWVINGLDLDWREKTYINPPYQNIEVWVDKLLSSSGYMAMLLPCDISTDWFLKIHDSPRCHIMFFHHRLYKNVRGSLLVIRE